MLGPRRIAIFMGVLLSTTVAQAKDPEPSRADQLFHDGRAAVARGDDATACAKFEQSYQLVPRNGTLLNLAVCLERSGERVSALRMFEQALPVAVETGRRDRENLARQHIARLRVQVAWLKLDLSRVAQLPGLELLLDASPLREPLASIPLEPGVHELSVTAAGRAPLQLKVELQAGVTQVLSIPQPAESAPTAAEAANQTKASAPRDPSVKTVAMNDAPRVDRADATSTWRKPVGTTLLGVGSAAIVGATILGVKTLLDGRQLRRVCPNLQCRDPESETTGRHLEARARVEARIVDVALPIGAVLASVAAYLLLSVHAKHKIAGVEVRTAAAGSPSRWVTGIGASW